MSVLKPEFQREAFASGAFLRVVNWHNTPESQRGPLRAELASYAKDYDSVLPSDLDRLFETGEWHKSKPGLIVVFYDSFLNNATVAAPICDELGLTAWFFPATAILSMDPADQREYAAAHHITLIEEEREQPSVAMTWEHLEQISKRHVIGAHTANHSPASEVLTAADAEREVFEPVRLIEQVTGRRPPAFAWLHGTAFDPESLAGRATLHAGIRYAVSNTVFQRIGD